MISLPISTIQSQFGSIYKLTIQRNMFGKINLFKPSSQPVATSSSSAQTKDNLKHQQSRFPAPAKTKKIKKSQVRLQDKYSDLQGAKFRLLNEMLYTNDSNNSVSYFKDNKQDFQLYHEGYRHQASKWEYRPVDQIIAFLLQNKQSYLKRNIADLGCGEGFIHESLVAKGFDAKRIKSYDLVSTKPFIKVADISRLPLPEESVSVAIFCLSLMGTNYLQFIKEARRILKPKGELIISEVESRSKDWRKFADMICAIGFELLNDALHLPVKMPRSKDEPRFFRTLHFKKLETSNPSKIYFQGKHHNLQDLSKLVLESCIYKKR